MAVRVLDDCTSVDLETGDADRERRRELREFLISSRSRLRPGEVGLPRTTRRRVPGLRRGEVAELIGVSVDWYRWFECGRSVRVSPQFVSRLVAALRISDYDSLTLYRLSIPEMYFAARRCSALGHLDTFAPGQSSVLCANGVGSLTPPAANSPLASSNYGGHYV
jgi:transcriptional regulator with XRE-family HTH domain